MADPAVLACQRCTRLKQRCNKAFPLCGQCEKVGAECVPVVRARKARGRNGGRPGGSAEMRDRIGKLESLVKSLSAEVASHGSASRSNEHTPINGVDKTSPLAGLGGGSGSTGSSNSESPQSTVPMGTFLFSQLRDEIDGIRDILDTNDDPELDEPDEEGRSTLVPAPKGLFGSPSKRTKARPIPNRDEVLFLLEAYRTRVHPVLRIVHLPTLEKQIHSHLLDQGAWPTDAPTAALFHGVFYAASTSLAYATGVEKFGIQKRDLQNLWRNITEERLVDTHLLVSERLETIQAFVLYLASAMTHDRSRMAWTLLPVAVRMAEALHLHREESYQGLPFYSSHIRRCVWACLLILDYMCSMDRGSDPCIDGDGFNTARPLHIRDEDFGPNTVDSPPPSVVCTENTFFTIQTVYAIAVRQLNFVRPRENTQPPTLLQYSWTARNEVVDDVERRTQYFLNLPDVTHSADAYRSLARIINATLRLYVVRPLQRHPAMQAPNIGAINVLKLATDVLATSLSLNNDAHKWTWWGTLFSNWHPLAVALAEIAVGRGDEVPEAWPIACKTYAVMGATIAEGSKGLLWRPIKKLMRAAEARQEQEMRCLENRLSGSSINVASAISAAPGYTGIPPATLPTTIDYAAPLQSNVSMTVPSASIGYVEPVNDMMESWQYWEGLVDEFATATAEWPLTGPFPDLNGGEQIFGNGFMGTAGL